MKNYLSVLAQFKNETMNLKVWIEHYLWQGVDHFYLIDNGSDDNPTNILQEYIDKGVVTYYYLPERHMQTNHYRMIFDKENLKKNTHWLIVCDLDEFFYGFDQKLKKKLKALDPLYDYILCNWYMFGSDGLIEHPEDIRTSIVHRKKDHAHIGKYIFKTNTIENSSKISIHSLINTSINIKKTLNDNKIIKLNHYPIQSLDFFTKVKMTRGSANTSRHEFIRNMDYFKNYDFKEYCDDTLKKLILNTPLDY